MLGDPILSQCDIDALRFVFSWAFAGTTPYPPSAGPYVCGDCGEAGKRRPQH